MQKGFEINLDRLRRIKVLDLLITIGQSFITNSNFDSAFNLIDGQKSELLVFVLFQIYLIL